MEPFKKYLLLLIFLATAANGTAQSKPKSKQEAPPTQKEMEAMMKEMQQEMDNLDPETKRAMDSMGIQMPSLNSLPKMTDAQIQEAYENDSRIVPLKDAGRIATISKSPLTNATMGAFVSTTHGKVTLQLKPASKTKGEEIYKLTKAQYNSDAATGNTAAGLWMTGRAELALYVMGKACIDNPANTDNLNNYASMLSMSGAEQLSIPMLNYVNQRFPKNSTVLNNIGQAWFGLGDIDKANNYLDSAIRLYPFHPQANFTKSFIEESKGNNSAAIESAKRSIKKAYTQKKEDRLSKLGYKLKREDVYWNRPMPADALGLEKFNWPDYPKNVEVSGILEKEWNVFRAACESEMEALRAQQTKVEAAMAAANQKRTKEILAASKKGLYVDPIPPLAPIAFIKLKYLVDGKDGQLAITHQKKLEAVTRAMLRTGELEKKESDLMESIRINYEDKFGEGKENPFDAACGEENGARNAFLGGSNTALQQAFTDYLNFLRRKLNDEVYYYQYTQWPEQFELTKLNAKLTWLGSIHGQKVMFRNKSNYCQEKAAVTEQKGKTKLAAFDDIHCQYHSELKTPVGTIKTDCSRMTTELDLKVIKLGLKQDMDRETFGDQFMSCSVEVGVGTSAGVNMGPLKAEASIGASLAAEFDRTGLTDVIAKTSAGVSAGTDIISDGSMAGVGVSDLSLDVGVKGQISIISGKSSVESTGLLDGVFKK
jgi:tetratricopeptide (TPR) repeat protein